MADMHDRISEVLLDTKKTNDELAQILGINKNTVSAYKNKHGDLKGIVLEGLVKNFNINPVWLLTGTGPKQPEKPNLSSFDKVAFKGVMKAIDEIIDEECLIISSDTKSDIIMTYYDGIRREIEELKKQGKYFEINDYINKTRIRASFYTVVEAIKSKY